MKLRDLPFVRSDSTGKITSLWTVIPSGNYAVDNNTGRDYFRSLMLTANLSANPLHITRVISEQVRQGNPDCPILIGFLHAMADELTIS